MGIKNLMRLLAVVVLAAVVAAGCGGGGIGGAGGGSIGENYDLSGTEITVGSKEFTEQLILGQMSIMALEAAGATVNDETGLAGTDAVRTALTSGEIDMYWEYVGTGWITHLGNTGNIPGENDFKTVAQRDLEKNNVKWFDPAPFSNGYRIAVNQENAEKLNVQTISDIGRVVEENPQAASLCTGQEFSVRDDGLPGMEKAYGFKFPDDQVKVIQLGIVYDKTAEGKLCNFGSVFETDGRVQNLNLVLLKDDKNFFPSYQGAVTTRQEVFKENPKLADIFSPISEKLTTKKMQELNAKVDVEGQSPENVAEQFLKDNGFIG